MKALDIAALSNVKRLLVHPAWHVGDDYKLDAEHKQQVRALVEVLRDHPGLYGYHLRDEPNVFPEEKLIVKPDYFDCLELLRTLSLPYQTPFWAFTCSVRHGSYPTLVEGHIRFQLMNNLAYGAQGLEYFTYAHDSAMVRPDGSTTSTWDIARRVNSDMHKLVAILRSLRNIGVFRHGPLWSGTRHLHRSHLQPLAECEGDPVTIGFFLDGAERLCLLVVNGNPYSWSRITLKVNSRQDKLYVFDYADSVVRELWPPDPHNQTVTLAPGAARAVAGHGSCRVTGIKR